MSVELVVDANDAGNRLDVLLVRRVEGMSRAKARRMIESGAVRVNGRPARKGARVDAGDAVTLDELPPPADFEPVPAPEIELVVRHEDPEFVIVDKPAGLPTHPLRPDERRTLAGALIARYPEMSGVGYALREPGIVHRLDNETSGLILAARTALAFDGLRALLVGSRIDKTYVVLVEGTVAVPQTIEAPIAPHPSDPRRVHVCLDPNDRSREKARPARTELALARSIAGHSLVEARASVAVRHQIRAHLASIGHPLIGDWLYGGPSRDGLERHFLHASRLAFPHPRSGRAVDVVSPLPPELERIVTALESA